MYLKLRIGQTKKPCITQTRNYTEHKIQTVHKMENIMGLGTVDRGARRGEERRRSRA